MIFYANEQDLSAYEQELLLTMSLTLNLDTQYISIESISTIDHTTTVKYVLQGDFEEIIASEHFIQTYDLTLQNVNNDLYQLRICNQNINFLHFVVSKFQIWIVHVGFRSVYWTIFIPLPSRKT